MRNTFALYEFYGGRSASSAKQNQKCMQHAWKISAHWHNVSQAAEMVPMIHTMALRNLPLSLLPFSGNRRYMLWPINMWSRTLRRQRPESIAYDLQIIPADRAGLGNLHIICGLIQQMYLLYMDDSCVQCGKEARGMKKQLPLKVQSGATHLVAMLIGLGWWIQRPATFCIPLCTGNIHAGESKCALHWIYPCKLISKCRSCVWWQCSLDFDNELEGQPLSSSHSALDTSVGNIKQNTGIG